MLNVPLDEIITPGTTIRVPGEGLPKPGGGGAKVRAAALQRARAEGMISRTNCTLRAAPQHSRSCATTLYILGPPDRFCFASLLLTRATSCWASTCCSLQT